MTRLQTEPNIPDADGFYEELLELHRGRPKEESDALNARLILLLANHIGDREVLREAMRRAADGRHPVRATRRAGGGRL